MTVNEHTALLTELRELSQQRFLSIVSTICTFFGYESIETTNYKPNKRQQTHGNDLNHCKTATE